MRILKLQFTNINSLAGTWHIDFTHPAYIEEGIFAITGPTGAGKSTILDAMCLALYGCTPRLRSITATENEAMSRQTGECSAEVTFQTGEGEYRCMWSQKRARKHPEGKLQPVSHEIVDAKTNRVITAKKKGVLETIISVTGMDFKQFTRSMLLAQGSFAAFLQADGKERAPVLEQITGTEVYSEISKYVFSRCATEATELEKIESALSGLMLLSEDDLTARSAELRRLKSDAAEVSARAVELRQIMAWREAIAALERSRAEINAEYHGYRERSAAAEPERETLRLADSAALLESTYARVVERQTEAGQLQQRIDAAVRQQPELTQKRDQAKLCASEAHARLIHSKNEFVRQADLWKKVRQLDISIREKHDGLAEAARALEATRLKLSGEQATRDDLSTQLSSIQVLKSELQREIESHAGDAALGEAMSAIDVMIDSVNAASAKARDKRAMADALTSDLRDLGHRQEAAEKLEAQAQNTAMTAASEVSACEERVASLLGGKTSLELRAELAGLVKRSRAFDEVLRLRHEIDDWQKDVQTLVTENQVRAEKMDALRSDIKRLECDEQARQKEVDHLGETVNLLKTIANLEAQRALLHDGSPCPLCGSEHHPYRHGLLPAPDDKQAALARAKEELKSVSDGVNRIRVQYAALEHDHASNEKLVSERMGQIASLDRTCIDMCAGLGAANDTEILAHESEQVKSQEKKAEERAAEVDQAIEAQHRAQQQSIVLKDNAHEVGIEAAKTRSEVEKAALTLTQLEADCSAAEAEITLMLNTLHTQLDRFGHGTVAVDHLESIRIDLRVRKAAWEERMQSLQAASAREESLRTELRSAESVCALLVQRAAEQRDDERRRTDECSALETVRAELFGASDPDEEERSRREAIEHLEESLTSHQDDLTRWGGELARLEMELEMLRGRITSCIRDCADAEAVFERECSAAGFSSVEDFTLALRPEDERKRMQERMEALRDEGTRLESRCVQKQKELDAEHAKALSLLSHAEAEDALRGATTRIESMLQTIGAIENQLRQNEETKIAWAAKDKEREARKREYARWSTLNKLIGSKGGEKFQRIAQAVTFQILVGRANEMLERLSPRYLLVCDPERDLEMNIIDHYQASTSRSTKNLSGGESFIVSLSLALGLSHMASRNVRVDSLFLDEGFGTLDEEALEVALRTLKELQASGKSIGVISHVSALKDSIATQIVVTPDAGGRSRLTGPGCTYIHSHTCF